MGSIDLGNNLHQLVLFALFLAIAAVVMGGFGAKAYHDMTGNENEDSTVGKLTVNDDAEFNDVVNVDGTLTARGALVANTTSTLTGAVTASSTLAVTGAASFTVGLNNPTGVIAPTWTSKTQMANGFAAALVKNTHYLTPADGNAFTATLPTAATSTAGDTIILEWNVAVTDGQTQKVGTSGEFYTEDSAIYRPNGSTGSAVSLIYTVDVADGTADDFANFIGLTNGGPGIGSYAVFTFNGSTWTLMARLTSSGTAAAANASVFATT